jgi:EpsI family protein
VRHLITTSSSVPFAATAALLVATMSLAGLTERRLRENLAVPLSQIDSRIDGWTQFRQQQLDSQTMKTLDATSYVLRGFRKENSQLDLFIAFYEEQRAGESMHSPKHCLPGSGWEIWRQDSALVPVNGLPVKVNKYSIQNLGKRMLMFYWYQSKDRIVASEYVGKLLLARDTLMTGQTAAAIVRVTLPDIPGADQKGVEFVSQVIPQVQRCFGGERFLKVSQSAR